MLRFELSDITHFQGRLSSQNIGLNVLKLTYINPIVPVCLEAPEILHLNADQEGPHVDTGCDAYVDPMPRHRHGSTTTSLRGSGEIIVIGDLNTLITPVDL